MALADRLKTLRAGRDLTQAELARRAGLAPSYVNRIESGQVLRPSYETIEALAGVLQVTPDALTEAGTWNTAPLVEIDPDADTTLRLVAALQTDDPHGLLRTLGTLSAEDLEAVIDMARRLARRPPARILGTPPHRRRPR